MYNITPSGTSPFAAMRERYGDRLVSSIIQDGQKIESNLQRITATRELRGLGETLSQLNPESDDWTQLATVAATKFPEAMRDPRGQFLFAANARANAQWQQTQRAIAQSNLTYGRQVAMEGLRAANRGPRGSAINAPVDLSGVDLTGSPMLGPSAGAGRSLLGNGGAFGFGAGMPSLNGEPAATQGVPVAPTEGADPTGTLMGIPPTLGGLADRSILGRTAPPAAATAPTPAGAAAPTGDLPLPAGSSANRAVFRDRGTGSLLGRALGPLQDAQRITGIPPTNAQVASAIAAQKRAEQAEAMQEDRQRQQEATATEREQEAEQKRAAAEARLQKTIRITALETELSGVERDIAAQRRTLETFMKEQAKKETLTVADHSQRAQLQADLQALGTERTRINKLLKTAESEIQTPPSRQPAAANPVLRYNPATRRLE